jgi:hypothetical protein
MTHKRWTRREMLQAAGAALALPALVPGHVLGGPNRLGPNEQVKVGVIGAGGRARGIVGESAGVAARRITAICDCFAPRADDFVRTVGKDQKWAPYTDFRRMIEKEKLDGVMIETTTHARAWIAILAMQAGVDTYIEKPICLTVAEGRAMVRAARKLGRVTQVGTQQRSMPINNWASDLVKHGAIGRVHTVVAPNFVGPLRWTSRPAQPLPKGGSGDWWDVWTNHAPLRPYHPDLQYGWATWNDYDGGGLCFGVTGWGAHSYDQVNRALGTDDTGPVEILLEEPVKTSNTGKFTKKTVGEEDTGSQYHDMARAVVGPRAKITMKFASGTQLKLTLDGDRGPGLGAIFIGEKGKIEIGRNKIASNPKQLAASPDNPGPNRKPETAYHVENWLECIKSRGRANADIEIGQRSNTLCILVNIARDVGKVGQPLQWDPAAERFTNCEEANRMLSRVRRKGYELPGEFV